MDLHMKQKLDTVTVFDLMNNSFYIPEKLILLKAVMEIYRNQTCLPVMTVDHIRPETDHRKN